MTPNAAALTTETGFSVLAEVSTKISAAVSVMYLMVYKGATTDGAVLVSAFSLARTVAMRLENF